LEGEENLWGAQEENACIHRHTKAAERRGRAGGGYVKPWRTSRGMGGDSKGGDKGGGGAGVKSLLDRGGLEKKIREIFKN